MLQELVEVVLGIENNQVSIAVLVLQRDLETVNKRFIQYKA